MFVFKPTAKTYSDPIAATFVPGIPFGREKSRGDICLLHEGFSSSRIYLNSHVLREAILNSKDFLEEVLDIKITDKSGKKVEKSTVDTKDVDVYIPEEQPAIVEEEPLEQDAKSEEDASKEMQDAEVPPKAPSKKSKK